MRYLSRTLWPTALCMAALSSTMVSTRARAQGDAVDPGASGSSVDPTGAPGAAPATPAAGNPAAPAAAPDEEIAAASDESQATTQVASFAPTQLKDSPAVVTVVSGEDIRAAGARDLIDILYMVPGYFMGVDTEGVVGPGFRGLWGHEGKILLMIDGKEMNELLFSNMQLGNEFPVELIERVEVVRGPGSVIYGGSAELSVINVVTRGLQGSTDLVTNVTYGQMTGANDVGNGYGQRKVTASGRLVFDSVPGLSTFASVSVGQGQRSVRNYVDNTGVAASMEGGSALDPTVVQAGVGYRDVQASFLYQHLGTSSISGSGSTVIGQNGTTVVPLPVSFDSYHGELIGTFRPDSRVEIVPRFNFTYQQPWRAPSLSPDLASFFYDKSVRRIRGRLLGRWAAFDQLQITVGGDAMFDEAKVLGPPVGLETDFVTPGGGTESTINYQTYATYIELFSENPIVNVAAGARYDHLSSVGGALVPRLVLLRTFGPLGMKALYSQSFRAPGIENINLGPPSPMPPLRAERTRIYEFEGTLDVAKVHRFSANVFDVAIDAPIAYALDTTTNTEAYRNLGRQGTRGFELSYRLRAPLVRLEANYSFYAPHYADNTPTYTVPGHPEQFLAAPAHHGSVRATFKVADDLGVTPSAVILGTRYTRGAPDVAGNPTAVAIPAQALVNLFVYKDNFAVRGLTVGLGLYNMFGAGYRYVHASALATYATDQGPLPGLDREVMLRVAYHVEPSDNGGGYF